MVFIALSQRKTRAHRPAKYTSSMVNPQSEAASEIKIGEKGRTFAQLLTLMSGLTSSNDGATSSPSPFLRLLFGSKKVGMTTKTRHYGQRILLECPYSVIKRTAGHLVRSVLHFIANAVPRSPAFSTPLRTSRLELCSPLPPAVRAPRLDPASESTD